MALTPSAFTVLTIILGFFPFFESFGVFEFVEFCSRKISISIGGFRSVRIVVTILG